MWKKRHAAQPAEKRTQAFGLPVDVMENLPDISLLGNREAVVERCQGVLEYNDHIVRLNTGRLTLKFTGRGLRLNCMTEDSVTVEGWFSSIEFVQ